MPFNGSGVFQRVRNWVADATAGIKVRADFHDVEDDGFATGLTNCITKDGQTLITQNIPFNNKRITVLADPVNPQDASTKAYADTKISSTGDSSLTGDLTIETDDPTVILDSAVGGAAAVVGKSDGVARWTLYLGDNTPEDGDDDNEDHIGSNFVLKSHEDDGTVLAEPLMFDRDTGLGKVLGPPTDDFGIVNKKYAADTFQAKDPQLFAGIPIIATPVSLDLTYAQKAVRGTGAVAIPANSSIAFPDGTCLTFIAYGGTMTVSISTDTMYWNDGGVSKTGSRTISNTGVATAIKVHATAWVFSGNGIT